MSEVVEQIKAERDYLIDRLYGGSELVGQSSTALLQHAISGAEGLPDRYPHDKGDLGRCEETYRRAPAHLQARMLAPLEIWREYVASGAKGLFCYGCRTGGHGVTVHNLCESCNPDGFAELERRRREMSRAYRAKHTVPRKRVA
jgi:hypothetical protein